MTIQATGKASKAQTPFEGNPGLVTYLRPVESMAGVDGDL